MIPAAQHAALKAIKAGIDEGIRLTQAETIDEAKATGADRWRTPYGTVSLAVRKDSAVVVDDRALLEYVRRIAPAEVVEHIRDTYRKALMDRLDVDGDNVVDTHTGEVVPWAVVKPGGDSYLAVRDASEAKKAAVDMVLAHLDEIAAFASQAPREIE